MNRTASSLTRCGLCVALLAVASSISIPLGPIPFTLQTLVLAMFPAALGGRDAVIAVGIYLLLGAIGLPVFSGFSGGIASLVGPSGGFLWGFFVGMVLAAGVLRLHGIPQTARDVLAPVVLLLASYALGTAQLMLVMHLALPEALALAVLPFVVPDIVKVAIGIQLGRVVRRVTQPHHLPGQ